MIKLFSLAMLLVFFRTEAATNIFNFSPTTLSAGAGPTNPTNGVVTISGGSLTAGDEIIFDGIVANVNGTTGDNWGSINLNAGGFPGLTTARFGVLGAGVQTVNYAGSSSPLHQWYLTDAGSGNYRIINRASNLALQTDNGNPATLRLAPASTTSTQL